jgi:hypothetical protein
VRMTGSSSVADDLKYLPDDSELFGTVDMHAVTNSDLYKRLRQETTLLSNFEKQTFGGDLALELADVQRITTGGSLGTTSPVVLIRTKKAVSLDELLAKNPKKYSQEEELGRTKVRHDGFEVVAIPERKTVLVGPYAAVKSILTREAKKATFSSPLQAAFNELDLNKSAAFAMDLQSMMARAQAGQPPMGGPFPFNPLAGPKGPQPESMSGYLELGSSLTVTLNTMCKSAQDAEEMKKQTEAMTKMFAGPIPIPRAPRGLADILKNIQVGVNGNKMSVSLSVANDTIVQAAKDIPGGPGR